MNEASCQGAYVGLSLTSLALVISVSLNILLYSLRRKERQNRDVEEPLYRDSIPDDRFEEDGQLNQDNPIYGNICMDGGGHFRETEYVCEPKTNQNARQDEQDDSADISYASLDLSVAQKRKKKRKYQQKQSHTHQVQTHPQPMAQQSCPEAGSDCEGALPSRSSSLMVSRNSIYLNSHQVALETEELERERERERKSNRAREIEIRNMYGDYNHGLGQSEPRHEQDD
ncbi:uncharacterized protein [Salminus brasiliensis]|uniref:uncharacterized protein n=1 Tax=Salminus brasiliensis TaxID=930266 RepID=UPI003B82EE29